MYCLVHWSAFVSILFPRLRRANVKTDSVEALKKKKSSRYLANNLPTERLKHCVVAPEIRTWKTSCCCRRCCSCVAHVCRKFGAVTFYRTKSSPSTAGASSFVNLLSAVEMCVSSDGSHTATLPHSERRHWPTEREREEETHCCRQVPVNTSD